MNSSKFPTTPLGRLKLFFTFFDSRWEDLAKDTWLKTVYQDFSAGLIVAMTAIPMAMGFAMAMGMRMLGDDDDENCRQFCSCDGDDDDD